MVATVESAFVLIDRASGPTRKIRREVRGLHDDARKAGRALDDMAGPRAARDLDRLAGDVGGVRRELGAVPTPARRAERALGDLDRTVVRSGRNARETSNYYAMLTDRTKLMAAAAVTALPVVQALAGGVTALAGSLYGAGLGAGAVGLAGGGVLAAGLGSVVSVAKPAQAALKETQKAQEAYTKAVQEHGKWSKEAAHAQRDLAQTYKGNPGIQRATREMRALNREWKELTQPGRREWFGLRGDLAQIGRRAAPRMAANANAATGAVRRSATRQARFLAGDFAQDTFATLTREFVHDLPIAERTLENIEVTVGRIAVASLPFFREGVEWVEQTTEGWRRSTKDAAGLRREVGGFVDDLKAWGDMTGSAFELVHDLFMGSRPAGRTMVEDFTETLDRWDRWVERNPEKIDRFFRNAVQDTEDIAESVGDIVHGLNDMATELRPLIAPLTSLVSLFGQLSSSLSPGAAATLLLGVRGLRGSIAGRGGGAGPAAAGAAATTAGAGGGMLPMILGGGAAAGGGRVTGGLTLRERGQRFMWQRQMAAQGALFGGAGMAGTASAARAASVGLGGAALGSAGRGARTAGRFALPAVAIGGLQGAFGPEGANQGEGWLDKGAWSVRNAAQGVGAMFGIANPVMGTDDRVNRGLSRAQQFRSTLPGGDAPTAGQARKAARDLGPELERAEQAAANAMGDKNKFAEAMAYLKALREQARAYRLIAKEAKHTAEVERNERSREHAYKLLDSFGKAFDTYSKRMGPDKAMDRTLDSVYDKMRGMNRTGAKILGENTLAWAAEQARANPALQDEVDRLARRIERRFSRMGDRVRVINGHILTGSRSQWESIATAITDPANRALSETSAAFRRLREEAVGQLELMGFTHEDALDVFRGVRKGTIKQGAVNERTGSGQSKMASDANLARSKGYTSPISGTGRGTGDAWGADAARTGRNPGGTAVRNPSAAAVSGTAGSLMGANAALGGYAQDAARFGLRVSSGLRPGSITNSGNVSHHSSGHALDLSNGAGPTPEMLAFAQHAASTYGSQLEELIYTPLGFSIKNGQRVPPYAQADHMDHVHLADVNPSGALSGGGLSFPFSPDTAGPGLINLNVPTSSLGGLPGAMANAAMGGLAAGMSQTANDAIGGGMFATGAMPGGASLGGDLASMVAAAGLPPIFNSIIRAESGGNPNARNPSGASGLTQIMMPLHNALVQAAGGNVFDPMTNLRVAKMLYDQAGLAPWTASRGVWGGAQGDGIGWTRPMLSGGALRAGGSRGGGRGSTVVQFNPQVAVNGSRRAEIVAMLNRKVEELADMVVEEIGSGREESEEALL